MFRIVSRPMFTAFKYLPLNCILCIVYLTSKYSERKNISLNVKQKKEVAIYYVTSVIRIG